MKPAVPTKLPTPVVMPTPGPAASYRAVMVMTLELPAPTVKVELSGPRLVCRGGRGRGEQGKHVATARRSSPVSCLNTNHSTSAPISTKRAPRTSVMALTSMTK